MEQSKPALAVFDLDKTITRSDTYLPFLAYICTRLPHRALKGIILPAAVGMYWTGRRDNSWLKERFWQTIAGGLSADTVRRWGQQFSGAVQRRNLRQGAVQRIERHRRSGDHLVLISASFDLYVNAIGQDLGFDEVLCTRAEIGDDGLLTGRLDGGNCYGPEKLIRLVEYNRANGGFGDSVVYSDHHSDLDILKWAAHGVAVHPTRKLEAEAHRLSLDVIKDW